MPRIRDLGYQIAISAFWGVRGARLNVGGIQQYPASRDAYGNDILIEHSRDFFGGDPKGGIVIPLTDIWVLRPDVLKELRTAAWVPVDHDPCQPPTVDVMREGNTLPIAMSRFGERMLKNEGFKPVYVPHGYDSSVFRPFDRMEARRALGLPEDAYIVGMVAANQGSRKSFPQAIRAFARFHRKHPDSVLYLHTWMGPESQGVDLNKLAEQELGRRGKECLYVCDQYRYDTGLIDDAHLANAYNALDLLMNPAQGEGFGVCIIESQACGTPVVLTNASAMPELCGGGYLVDGTPVYTSFKSWQLLPDVDQLVEALEHHYALGESERLAMRQRALDFAGAYDADRVTVEYWQPALLEIADRLTPRRTPRKQGTAAVPGKRRR
ncbi:MAG TPA: glycosyltransferase [Gaiellaceae bacterium]|nr:glycosyltransferase [Gaiellaceae bacterium]